MIYLDRVHKLTSEPYDSAKNETSQETQFLSQTTANNNEKTRTEDFLLNINEEIHNFSLEVTSKSSYISPVGVSKELTVDKLIPALTNEPQKNYVGDQSVTQDHGDDNEATTGKTDTAPGTVR